jgi:hypothetical protein
MLCDQVVTEGCATLVTMLATWSSNGDGTKTIYYRLPTRVNKFDIFCQNSSKFDGFSPV